MTPLEVATAATMILNAGFAPVVGERWSFILWVNAFALAGAGVAGPGGAMVALLIYVVMELYHAGH